jgi:hypothetical protein
MVRPFNYQTSIRLVKKCFGSPLFTETKMTFAQELEQLQEEDIDGDDEEGPKVDMNWNLATYLPEAGACQKNFFTVIVGELL